MMPPRGTASHAPALRAPSAGDDARVLPFRRRPFAARRKRPGLMARLVLPFAGALMMVGSPAALAAWVLASPRFGLKEVELEGGSRVSQAWAMHTLAPLLGRSLLLLPLAEVEARMARHPWVRSVEARKEMPNRLRLLVVERQPVALLRHGSELTYLDHQGLPFAPCDPLAPDAGGLDLLLVSSAAGPNVDFARALLLAEEFNVAQPEWAAALSEVEMMGDEDYRLVTAALPFSLLVRRTEVAAGVRRLQPMLTEILSRYPGRIAAVDLRFPQRLVLQPRRTAATATATLPAAAGAAATPTPTQIPRARPPVAARAA
jgi:cell division septal protein FtsQ